MAKDLVTLLGIEDAGDSEIQTETISVMTTATGFTERWSLTQAWAWLDARPHVRATEAIPLDHAFQRILAASLTFPESRPVRDVVTADGFAVQSESTIGASAYNPLSLTIVPQSTALGIGCASVCHAGGVLPLCADAVLPLEAGELVGSLLEICAPVARGQNVGTMGEAAKKGEVAIARGRRLGAAEIALASLVGVDRLEVLRRPDVALVIAGPKPSTFEAIATALTCLIARDGGVARVISASNAGLAADIRSSAGADVVLVAGRSGWGDDDTAAGAIVEAGGRLDHHGLAMTPGSSAGFGGLGEASLLLLPGDPLAALVTYDLLAGRLVRRLAGHTVKLPYPNRRFKLTRKIASPIGTSEWIPVRCHGSNVEPLPLPQTEGLAGLGRADGFLIVPAGLEGYAPGESIDVYVTAEVSGVQERS